jgi:hypothetical protein
VALRTNLALVLLGQGRTAEARYHATEALRVMPAFAPAQQVLQRLADTSGQ